MNRFSCKNCGKSFQSQKDVDRHQSSVHDKSATHFCYEQGCSRFEKGFTRKDNLEAHLRRGHRKLSKNANRVKGQDRNTLSEIVDPEKEIGEGVDLEGYSREQLTDMVVNERERFKMEKQRRQEVEEELKSLRQRYDEREDMWLRLFATKEGSN